VQLDHPFYLELPDPGLLEPLDRCRMEGDAGIPSDVKDIRALHLRLHLVDVLRRVWIDYLQGCCLERKPYRGRRHVLGVDDDHPGREGRLDLVVVAHEAEEAPSLDVNVHTTCVRVEVEFTGLSTCRSDDE